MFFHSSSYTANAVACAVAAENLAIWRDEPVMDRVLRLGATQRMHLERLADHPALVRHRHLGTIAAVDFIGSDVGYLSDVSPRLVRFFADRDLLIRPLGNTVYVMPPYCIDAADLDAVWLAITEAADQIANGRWD